MRNSDLSSTSSQSGVVIHLQESTSFGLLPATEESILSADPLALLERNPP